MTASNLTVDGEWRYIITWFLEWSEIQRDDFLPILIEYLTKENNAVFMNGIVSAVSTFSLENDKPMSLFQCRIKLFKQWSSKWPEEFKKKLSEKLTELDTAFGERIKNELTTNPVDDIAAIGPPIQNNDLIELVQIA